MNASMDSGSRTHHRNFLSRFVTQNSTDEAWKRVEISILYDQIMKEFSWHEKCWLLCEQIQGPEIIFPYPPWSFQHKLNSFQKTIIEHINNFQQDLLLLTFKLAEERIASLSQPHA